MSKPYGDIRMCVLLGLVVLPKQQGLNFTDAVYTGVYRGKVRHSDDRSVVLKRAWDVGVSKIIITGILLLSLFYLQLVI